MKLKKTVSPAVREKNQKNAKKSTGPQSERGKAISRYNAVKHGLTAKHLMFAPDGQPLDNGVTEILEALQSRYGSDDLVTQLLIDNLAVDVWRQRRGLEAETFYLSRKDWSFHAQGSMSTLMRYNVSNRRAMLKSLELLEKFQSTASPAVPDEVSRESTSEVDQSQAIENVAIESEKGSMPPADPVIQPAAERLATEGCAKE